MTVSLLGVVMVVVAVLDHGGSGFGGGSGNSGRL